MRIDGKAIAQEMYTDLSAFFKARHAKLGIVVVGHDPVIEQFVRIKSRAAEKLAIEMVRVDLPESASTSEVIEAVHQLHPRVDGLIVQLPLPAGRQGYPDVDTNAALSAVPVQKDVDAINPRHSIERLVEAPVALAVLEILARAGTDPAGKQAVVVGAGRLVGVPTYELLKRHGAHVSFFTLKEGDIGDLKNADIVVCGAGKPGLIKPEHLKQGVVLIDAGASEQGKKVRGDADPACEEVASVFTPVPGGVGPIAVAMIFRNIKRLMEAKK